jgi:hypothetical protein
MKRRLFLLLTAGCLLGASGARAQSTRATAAQESGTLSGNSVLYSLPQTALTIRVTVQKETIRRGPYSRFAQQYLGVVAPLSDKDLYTLSEAALSWAAEADPSAVYVLENPEKSLFDLYVPSAEGFIALDPGGQRPAALRFAPAGETPAGEMPGSDANLAPELPIDRLSASDPGLEAAAAQAAQTLFTLRRRRFDLVSGEAGENVFGAGLSAALDELKRQEEAYIALFMGTRTIERIVRSYEVVPEAGKNTVIVCRFSETGGLLPDSDLSGRPLLLEMTPEGKTQRTVLPRPGGRESRGSVFYRVADVVRCRLLDEMTVLADRRVPIYQFGEVVDIPVTSIK